MSAQRILTKMIPVEAAFSAIELSWSRSPVRTLITILNTEKSTFSVRDFKKDIMTINTMVGTETLNTFMLAKCTITGTDLLVDKSKSLTIRSAAAMFMDKME